jgi:hypothetical protein
MYKPEPSVTSCWYYFNFVSQESFSVFLVFRVVATRSRLFCLFVASTTTFILSLRILYTVANYSSPGNITPLAAETKLHSFGILRKNADLC